MFYLGVLSISKYYFKHVLTVCTSRQIAGLRALATNKAKKYLSD